MYNESSREDHKPTDHLTHIGNRVLDLITKSSSGEILNTPPWNADSDQAAQILLKTSKKLKGEAIDPSSGRVDYSKMASSESYARLREVTRSLPNYDPQHLEQRSERIAFWINVYNALILDAVVHYKIKGSLLRYFRIFRRAAYNVSGLRFSADDIEHGILRGNRPHPIYPLRTFSSSDP